MCMILKESSDVIYNNKYCFYNLETLVIKT